MSCLSRKVVENRVKRQQAKEDGNTGLLFGLLIVGGLLFAGHSMLTQMHHFHRSMKDIFRSLVSRNTVKQVGEELEQVGKTLARDEVREIAPHVMKDNERE